MRLVIVVPCYNEEEVLRETASRLAAKLRELAEIERRTFGTPVFEHKGDVRLPSIDDEGEWDVMAVPRILGDDHRVDEEVVDALQDQLLESMTDHPLPTRAEMNPMGM